MSEWINLEGLERSVAEGINGMSSECVDGRPVHIMTVPGPLPPVPNRPIDEVASEPQSGNPHYRTALELGGNSFAGSSDIYAGDPGDYPAPERTSSQASKPFDYSKGYKANKRKQITTDAVREFFQGQVEQRDPYEAFSLVDSEDELDARILIADVAESQDITAQIFMARVGMETIIRLREEDGEPLDDFTKNAWYRLALKRLIEPEYELANEEQPRITTEEE